jgi:peptidoglycan/LPS O-acetylase OafA/YrhL
VYQLTGSLALAQRPLKFSSEFYAIVFILAFLSIDVTKWRVSGRLNWLGAHSYGIYLSNPVLLEWTARFIRYTVPGLLSFQFLLMTVLAVTSILVIGVIMEGIARSRMRGAYHYLFG